MCSALRLIRAAALSVVGLERFSCKTFFYYRSNSHFRIRLHVLTKSGWSFFVYMYFITIEKTSARYGGQCL
jgi:hypothetical protein